MSDSTPRERLLVPLFSGAGMRELDRRTIEERGIPGAELMEAAGAACWDEIAALLQETGGCRVIVVTGKGNNGGDGFVIARLAAEAGCSVTVMSAVDPSTLTGDAAAMYRELPDELPPSRAADPAELMDLAADADVVVDALLGTGVKGAPRAPFDAWIAAINAARRADLPVASIDLPSGLDADGATTRADLERDDHVVQADLTVTIGAPKLGLALHPGAEAAGRVIVASINFPPDLLDAPAPDVRLLTESYAAALLPPRPADGHKGTFGRAVIIAGSPAYGGAAVLATRAALRSGAGYVITCCDPSLHPLLLAAAPEAIVRGLPDSLRVLAPSSVVIGPGLGDDRDTLHATFELLREAMESDDASQTPVILDADGLRLLDRLDTGSPRNAPLIITPHPGELARLLGTTSTEIQTDRLAASRTAAERFRATVVLKGAATVIAHPNGRTRINPTGNTGLAKAGSGDVLAGLIGGLAAQMRATDLSAQHAVELGVFFHGLAADLLAARSHPRAMTSGDLPAAFADAFRHLDDIVRRDALGLD